MQDREVAPADKPKPIYRPIEIVRRAMSPKQAWTYIGVKRGRFYQLAADGIIKIHKFGIKSIIYREDLDELLDGIKDGTITIAPATGKKAAAPAGTIVTTQPE